MHLMHNNIGKISDNLVLLSNSLQKIPQLHAIELLLNNNNF